MKINFDRLHQITCGGLSTLTKQLTKTLFSSNIAKERLAYKKMPMIYSIFLQCRLLKFPYLLLIKKGEGLDKLIF